jgi:hypothetical protein
MKLYTAIVSVPADQEAFDLLDPANVDLGELPPGRIESVRVTNIGAGEIGLMVNDDSRLGVILGTLADAPQIARWCSRELGIHPIIKLYADSTTKSPSGGTPGDFTATTLMIEAVSAT